MNISLDSRQEFLNKVDALLKAFVSELGERYGVKYIPPNLEEVARGVPWKWTIWWHHYVDVTMSFIYNVQDDDLTYVLLRDAYFNGSKIERRIDIATEEALSGQGIRERLLRDLEELRFFS